MRLYAALLCLSFHVLATSSLTFKVNRSPLQRRDQTTPISVSRPNSAVAGLGVLAAGGGTGGANGLDLSSVHDLIYIANATVGGINYPLQLDTGSSDLWVKGVSSPLPHTQETSTTYNLTYGIGWAFGSIAYAPVTFAGISTPSQALLDVTSANNPALGYGASGILGLGFTSLSTIDAALNSTGSSTGRSLLFNLFAANSSQPNFISFAMQRTTDLNSDVEGSFAIGEYVPQYAGVADTPAIPTWPMSAPTRWTVLLESFIVNGANVPVSTTVDGAPSNLAVVLLDSGTSYTYAPVAVCDAIYKGVPGAQFDPNLGQWIVPCGYEIDMAIQIGGRVFPMHPLDVSPYGIADPSICVGSFVPQSVTVSGGQFDWLIGDNVLRSLYTIYDFGDFLDPSGGATGDPYVKLLALTDPNKASAEFHAIRGGTPSGNITYNATGSPSSGITSVSLSDQVAKSLAKLGTYLPIILGILALNALVLVVAVIVAIAFLCRGKSMCGCVGSSKKRKAKGQAHTLVDMPMGSAYRPSRGSDGSDEAVSPQRYHPVSMAITEDTMFVPSTPSFPKGRKWNPDSSMSGRPTINITNDDEPASPSVPYYAVPMAITEDSGSVPSSPTTEQRMVPRASIVSMRPSTPTTEQRMVPRASIASMRPSTPTTEQRMVPRASMASVRPSVSFNDDEAPPSPVNPFRPSSSYIVPESSMPTPPAPLARAPSSRWNPESLVPLPPSDRPRTAIFASAGVPTPVDPSRWGEAQGGDELFTPPRPGFRMVDGERPRSIA